MSILEGPVDVTRQKTYGNVAKPKCDQFASPMPKRRPLKMMTPGQTREPAVKVIKGSMTTVKLKKVRKTRKTMRVINNGLMMETPF